MKERLLVRLVEGIFMGIGLLGVLELVFTRNLLFLVSIVISLIFLTAGLKQIPEERRWIIEAFGKFYAVKGPGLSWVCPFVCRARAQVTTQEQRYPLFEKPIRIDFRDGSATPRDAEVFVRIKGARELEHAIRQKDAEGAKKAEEEIKKSAYKMVYSVRDVKESTVDLLENAVRSYLNSLNIKEGIEKGGGGYDVLNDVERNEKKTKKQDKGVREKIEEYGLEVNKITIGDFDLSDEVIRARESVLKAKRSAEAARSIAIQKALESGGMHAEIKKILCENYGYKPEEAEKIAEEYVKYFKGAETGVIRDIRVPKEVIQAISAIVIGKKKKI